MRPGDLPVMAALRQSMNFHADRQQVIAENVANANTPGYTARDMNEADFQRAVRAQLNGGADAGPATRLRTTSAGHIPSGGAAGGGTEWRVQDSPDSETTINGNSVVLEEQMVRGQENRMRYETALTLYQKNLGLIRMAIKPPAR